MIKALFFVFVVLMLWMVLIHSARAAQVQYTPKLLLALLGVSLILAAATFHLAHS